MNSMVKARSASLASEIRTEAMSPPTLKYIVCLRLRYLTVGKRRWLERRHLRAYCLIDDKESGRVDEGRRANGSLRFALYIQDQNKVQQPTSSSAPPVRLSARIK